MKVDSVLFGITFVATGCLPFGFGVYLACKEDFTLSIGSFLLSFLGFKQAYDSLKYVESRKKQEVKGARIIPRC